MFFQQRLARISVSLLLATAMLLAALGRSSPAAAQTAGEPALVQVIDTSAWIKPSPDPSGITYWPAHNTLVIADGEVDEMTIFAGANVFESSLSGTYVAGYNITSFNNEAVGIDIDVAPNGHFFISNDSKKTIFDINLVDGVFNNGNDVIRSFSTSAFGNNDPEGLTLGPSGKLYTVDGAGQEIYVTDAGSGGVFGDGNDTTTHFDVAVIGINDPEGVDYNTSSGTLYVADRKGKRISEITTTGGLIRVIDLRPWGVLNPGDVTLAPGSNNASETHLYVAARGVDNNTDPNENDGKVYEISLGSTGGGDTTPPTVTSHVPATDATNVAVATNVTATFSENVTGVNETSFKLEGPGGTPVSGVVSYDAGSRTATLNPDADLAADTVYTAQLTGAIKDAADNALSSVTWSFTTVSPTQDTTPPTVIDRAPASGATNVNVASTVTAIFSEGVVGVSASSFTLTKQGGGTVAATVGYNSADRTATLDPTSNLEFGTTYIAQLSNAITDAAGNPLATVSWTFTTSAAAPPPTNLLLNPGFETDANGDGQPDVWSTNSRFSRLCAPNVPAPGPHQGSCVGKFTATDNSDGKSSQVVDGLIAGATYSFAGWVNIPATSDSFTFKLQVQWLNSSNSSISTKTVTTYSAATSGWQQATFIGAAPTGTAKADIRLVATSLNLTIYVDDISFTSGSGTPNDTTAPTVTAQTPASGATGVATGTSVTATFSESVNGVSSTTFKLTPQGSGTAVGATVSYDAANKKATLVPTSALSANTTYTAQLTSGITDLAGNALVAISWNFTTAASGGGTTLTFTPVADTFVNQSSPSTASGGSTSFSIVGGTNSAKIAYIRFNVTGLPAGAVVQSAKLRLFVTNDSTSGGVFNRITNNTWAETINWNTKPAIDGPQVASLGAVAKNVTIEVNLTATITGNGTYSFAIALPNTNTNTLGYASKEQSDSTRRPQLVVVTQ